MTRRPFKIGIAGTHSTGKSTFIARVKHALINEGKRVCCIDNLARRAHLLGFPILTEHTYESTLWIMAECMRQEAEASLNSDVILIDRPVPDALGYLLAALELTGRRIDPRQVDELTVIAKAHISDYDFLVATVIDHSIDLGEGRDTDVSFRSAAANHISAIMLDAAPAAKTMSFANSNEIIAEALLAVRNWRCED